MIIKTHSSLEKQQKSAQLLKKSLLLLGGALALSAIYLLTAYIWKQMSKEEVNYTLLADAEVVEGDNFVLGEYIVGRSISQSSDFAYEGKHSVKLGKQTQQYGFSINLKGFKVGDRLTAQVWAYSPSKEMGHIAIAGLDIDAVYAQSDNFAFVDDWQLLQVSILLENPVKDNTLKIYCFNYNNSPIYFDNLAFTKHKNPELETNKNWEPENIHLFVKEGDYNHLKKKRNEAIQMGLIINSDDSWVKGAIYPKEKNEEKINISLRLKGDWTDHLQGEQWSFRVQTQTDKAWNRLKTFSLQNPSTRSYLFEWMLHEFYRYEDILTTRYEFINVKLNSKDLGLYVYEEHFLKQLPEYSKKKEGPILRFLESGFWEAQLQMSQLQANLDGHLLVGSPEIKPFEEKKTFNTPLLAEQYVIAQNLLYEYQYGLKEAKDIFDIDLLAKYYAIVDITGGYHGIAWHNQRYYYNPVISKLEPIGFDGFGEGGLAHVPQKPFLGISLSAIGGYQEMHRKLFRDHGFLEKYHHYLEKFTETSYLDAFVSSIEKKYRERLFCIQKSIPSYKFNPKYIYQRAANIRHALYPNSASVQTKTIQPGLIAICNRHQIPIEILGSMSQSGGIVTYLDSPQVVYSTDFAALPDYTQKLNVPTTAKYLVYRVMGLKKDFYASINPWPVPEAFAPVQELVGNLQENHPAYLYHPDQKHVLFNRNATINEPIIIPAGLSVTFKPGIKLDITNNAFVLCYSAVQFLGTEAEPILVHSSDATARSFTVIKANAPSKINYTTFSNLGAFSYKGWNLPGAVNFYESNIDIYHSTFTKNRCEDALNIVRADFDFQYNTISHTFADGFDSDFCKGTVAHCTFFKTGNDAIDFSTSVVTIRDSKINQAGDKGISMGEQGTATVLNCVIDGAVIGIASKDLSKTTIKNVHLKNCQTGFSAYQKKPEYGEGYLYVQSYTAENLGTVHKILPGSYLKLVDQEIKGN